MSVLAVILVMIVEMLEATQRSLSQARRRTGQFREAEVAFATISRHLSQATLQTFLAYDDPTQPNQFVRESQLHFLSGEGDDLIGPSRPGGAGEPKTHSIFFQGPFGYTLVDPQQTSSNDGVQGNVLNAWGYFVEFGNDEPWRPSFMASGNGAVPTRTRFRLMEFRAPAEYNLIFKPNPNLGSQGATGLEPFIFNLTSTDRGAYRFWFDSTTPGGVNSGENYSTGLSGDDFRSVRMVAENIIALVIRPKVGNADLDLEDTTGTGADEELLYEGYNYDSRNWQWTTGGDHTVQLSGASANSKNVLPPVVEIVIVAIDEASAATIVSRKGESALEGLLASGLFKNPGSLDNDLDVLEADLSDERVSYRVFRTSVVLRESNWSEQFNNSTGP